MARMLYQVTPAIKDFVGRDKLTPDTHLAVLSLPRTSHIHCLRDRVALHDLNVRFHHNRGHESRIQPHSETEIRFFFRPFLNLKGDRQIDREYQVMPGIVTKYLPPRFI